MANGVFNKGLLEILNLDVDAQDLRVLLVTSGYTFDNAHNFVADVVASELTVSGYSRQTLANEAITEDDTNDRAYLDADDPTFSSLAAGETIGGAIVFRHTGADATAPLLFFIDLTNTPTNGTDFKVQFAAPGSGGIAYLAQA